MKLCSHGKRFDFMRTYSAPEMVSVEGHAKPDGARQTHEEVGVYTVKDDIVTREEFYYDGTFIERPPTWSSAR